MISLAGFCSGSWITSGCFAGVGGAFPDVSSFATMSGLPQRTQYFRIGLFAFPQLGHVLKK
jgi:hypothetical protein